VDGECEVECAIREPDATYSLILRHRSEIDRLPLRELFELHQGRSVGFERRLHELLFARRGGLGRHSPPREAARSLRPEPLPGVTTV
jgi:hypothetical protein